MKSHETNEKNQVKELSKVELSDLSEEEMRSTMGGVTNLFLTKTRSDSDSTKTDWPNGILQNVSFPNF